MSRWFMSGRGPRHAALHASSTAKRGVQQRAAGDQPARRRVFFRCSLEPLARVLKLTRGWSALVHGSLVESGDDTWVQTDRHGADSIWYRGDHGYPVKAPCAPEKREIADLILVSHAPCCAEPIPHVSRGPSTNTNICTELI